MLQSQKTFTASTLASSHIFETLASGINIHYLTLENTILELTELPKQTISGMHFCLMTDTFTVSFNQL
nr:hypothetical protein [Piscirickettsia salmonis]